MKGKRVFTAERKIERGKVRLGRRGEEERNKEEIEKSTNFFLVFVV
jgi:hypothetical protein